MAGPTICGRRAPDGRRRVLAATTHPSRNLPATGASPPGNAARPRRGTEGAESGSATSTTDPNIPRGDDITALCALESERLVVGAAMLGHPGGLHSLDADRDLTDPRLQALARAVGRLEATGAQVEPVAVLAELRTDPETGWAHSAAIGVYICELVDVSTVPIPASAGWHARVVREATARRDALTLAARVEDMATTVDLDAIVGRLEVAVAEVSAAVRRVTS